MKIFRQTAIAAASAVALCAALPSGDAAAAETVTVGFAIPFTVTDGPMYAVAEKFGYFADENIDPEFIFLTGAAQVIPQVAARQIMIGQPLPDPMLAAVAGGQDIPVVFFYNALPLNTIQLAVLADSDIESLEDFEGRSVGVGALTWGTIPGLRAMLRAAGLQPGQNVDIVPVGILGAGFQALREGRVDALNYNNTWIDLLEGSGTAVRRIALPETYEGMINNAYVTHERTLEENPELLAGFGRAMAKATFACTVDPAVCVRTFWELYPESKPAEGSEEENLANAVRLLERRLELIVPAEAGGAGSWGRFDQAAIARYVDFMHEAGEFPTADIPVEEIFTNQLADAFVDFDEAAVRADVEAAR